MSLHFASGDIFATERLTHIAHGVNLCGVFGAGIAGQIARSRPWARIDYMAWYPTAKLGDICVSVPPSFIREGVVSKIPSAKANVIHMATQGFPGADAQIAAIDECARKLYQFPGDCHIAIPQIGCGIGGLKWQDVKTVLQSALSSVPCRVWVFETYIEGQPLTTRR